MIRLLVVDDQILIRAGLAALLRATPDIDVIGEAASGEEAIELATRARPDVVLMDVRMPGVNGLDATRTILSAGLDPVPKVVILTTFDLDEYVYDALRAGATGFLLKDTPPEQLMAAVAAAASGEMLFAPTVLRRLVEAYVDRTEGTPPPARALEMDRLRLLTTREREVLRLVARGMSNAEIASDLFITGATVKTHLNRAMTKLTLTSRAQAVVVAYETGLVTPRNR